MLLLGLLLLATLSTPVLAAEDPADPAADDRPAIALRLSPAVLEVPHGPGPSRHELRVDNLGSEPLTIDTQLSEFTVTADGTTQFLGPDEVSATAWATLDVDRFELEPGERRDVGLTVEVPDDAEPGERYLSAIFAVPGDPDSDGNITVTHRAAAKLYIEVPGARVEHVELGELTGPRLIDGRPGAFELTIHNGGNVHRQFQEDTQLSAYSGDQRIPFENFTVLGDSTRMVEAVWSDPPLVCWCTVEVELDDGGGTILTASTRVLVFPLRLSLALLALVAGLVILALGRHRRRGTPSAGVVPSPATVVSPPPEPAPRPVVGAPSQRAQPVPPHRPTPPSVPPPMSTDDFGSFTARGGGRRRRR